MRQKRDFANQIESLGIDRSARKRGGSVVPSLRSGCRPRAISSDGMDLSTVLRHGPHLALRAAGQPMATARTIVSEFFEQSSLVGSVVAQSRIGCRVLAISPNALRFAKHAQL